MSEQVRLTQGTAAWFDMVGRLMCETAKQARLSPSLNISFLERYTDGVEVSEGLIQGLRFDIVDGKPFFRVGAAAGESADITVEITSAAARKLNSIPSADPTYESTRNDYLRTGDMRVVGDPSQLGGWLDSVHDPIINRTM